MEGAAERRERSLLDASEKNEIMINTFNKSKQSGTFTLLSGKDVYGELSLRGRNTSLYLQDRNSFERHDISGHCVKGILHDLTKVTLLQCTPSSFRQEQHGYTIASIFPHYVVHGNHHIDPAEKKIIAVHFVVDDATILFYDIAAFGILKDARPFIEQIVHANGFEGEILTGPDPQILYFTGKREIFAVDTVLGRVSASHNPSHNFGGPDGVWLENTIFVTIDFREAVTFKDTIAHVSTLLRYIAILVGRRQNLIELNINIESDDELPAALQVYWSMSPKRGPSYEEEKPHPHDILVDAIRQPAVFSSVLASWLERQQAWQDARLRFFGSFTKQHYSNDRLIRSANMFDILPSSAVPSDIKLPDELKQAKEECRTIFKNLPLSLERESVLNALGRVGKSALKHKIRHRGQRLIDAIGERVPDLFTVTDEAVNCRNYYVHGNNKNSFDYSNNLETVFFLTDTLEFVFATSDLIEAGWDAKVWTKGIETMFYHPFAKYLNNYTKNLQTLKNLIV